MFHRYVYGVVPPLSVKSTDPVAYPLHNIFTPEIDDVIPIVGSVRVIDWLEVQPLLSVIVTEYVPAASPDKSCVTSPVFHRYVYGVVPSFTDKSIVPLLSWKHNRFVPVIEDVSKLGSVRVMDWLEVQPLSSVIVTEYVPAVTLIKF